MGLDAYGLTVMKALAQPAESENPLAPEHEPAMTALSPGGNRVIELLKDVPGSVVGLGPHPDDPDAAAVACRLFVRHGSVLSLVIVTLGPSGVDPAYAKARVPGPPLSLREKQAQVRCREQAASAQALGVPPKRLSFLGVEPPRGRTALFDCLMRLEPDVVILPAGKDTNPTHVWVHGVFREAARHLVARRKKRIVALYNEDPKTTSLDPDLLVVFGERTAQWKRSLLRMHDSQQQRNLRLRGMGFDERILGMNRRAYGRYHPAGAGEPAAGYAEAYEVEVFGGTERPAT